MKKRILISLIVIITIVIIGFVLVNFIKRTDVFLGEYTVTNDGTQISMDVGVASSMGYLGRYSTKQVENRLYVTFYSALRGHNTFAGGNLITIDLPQGCDEIYFNRSGGEYELMIQKNNETGEWERVIAK